MRSDATTAVRPETRSPIESCRIQCKTHDEQFLAAANRGQHELVFPEPRLTTATAALASGFDAVCAFVNDDLSANVLRRLAAHGVVFIALRSAGFNHVDLHEAAKLQITVTRVPAYSPHAVAEHAVGLILALNRISTAPTTGYERTTLR